MSTTDDSQNILKKNIDNTDNHTITRILQMLEVKPVPVWWNNKPAEDVWVELNNQVAESTEEKKLSLEQVKQMYPHWFKD